MPAPTYLDLMAFIDGRGIAPCRQLSKEEYQAAIERAITGFEEATGWIPFIIGESETKTFDQLTGDPLWLPVGLQTITAMSIGLTSLSVDNLTLRRRRHDHPPSGIDMGRAITKPISLTITGTFGFADDFTVSDKVAIMAKAAYEMYPALMGFEGNVIREKQGPVEFEYADSKGDPYAGQRGALLSMFDDAVEGRLRVS